LADRSPSPAIATVILDETGSTNVEAFKRAAEGEAGPLWIMARRQTQGRGRSGRQWASEPGNLYASLLQRLACPPGAVAQLSLLAGVAVVEAIVAAAGRPIPGLRLKWPNDVLIGGAKCAGILAESQSAGAAQEIIVVVGVGINLASHPEGLGRATTDLAAHGISVAPEVMLGVLAPSIARWLGIWGGGAGFPEVRRAWLGSGGAVGEGIVVDTGRERISGSFLGLDEAGALLLRDAQGAERRLTFGDVTLARSQSAAEGA
jgi:BirA family transcriptional regulator, biotin operon repressor / biotin---[acetyl-CoA-carboxylase] ligase